MTLVVIHLSHLLVSCNKPNEQKKMSPADIQRNWSVFSQYESKQLNKGTCDVLIQLILFAQPLLRLRIRALQQRASSGHIPQLYKLLSVRPVTNEKGRDHVRG
jgi:chromosome segregation and condensation protein ScpB